MKAIVSQKGQITIPKAIRNRLGIVPGTVLEFEASGGSLIAKKMEEIVDPVAAVTGIIEKSGTIDSYLDATRGSAE